MNLIKKKKGFTLLELMLSVAILSIVGVGLLGLFRDGLMMWNMGTARLSLTAEARVAMMAVRKMIQQCQGATISISRFNSSQPANSYISAVLMESVFIETVQTRCGCGGATDPITVGATGAPVELFQKGTNLLSVFPVVAPGTDWTDKAEVTANTTYKTLTISANVESIMFSFLDSKKGNVVVVGARFSKKAWQNRPPVSVYIKESVIVKHMHSAGYYYN